MDFTLLKILTLGRSKSVDSHVHLRIPFPVLRQYQRHLLYSHQWINPTYVPGKTLNDAIDDETSLRDHYGKRLQLFLQSEGKTHEVKSWPAFDREMRDIKCALLTSRCTVNCTMLPDQSGALFQGHAVAEMRNNVPCATARS